MKFLQRTPFFRLLLALVSGIVLFNYTVIPVPVLIGLFVFSFLILLSLFFIRNSEILYRFRWLYGFGTIITFTLVGYVLCLNFNRKNEFTELNQRSIYEVELITSPVVKPRSNSFRVKLLNRLDSNSVTKVSGKAIVYLQKDSVPLDLLLGDRILIDAEFKAPDGAQNPNGFDYAAYLKRQGVGATVYIATDKWKKYKSNTNFSIRRLANISRNHLLEIYRKYNITDDEFMVLAALTLGYKEGMDPDLYKLYSNTGAVHILAVSGLHVGIVYMAISFLLGFLKRNRKEIIAKALISILFIWSYAIITGLSPAVIRAATMMSFVAGATLTNRKPRIYNSILGSAFFILLFDPNLLYNIGFQLSYSAVLSIIVFQSSLAKFYVPKNKFMTFLWGLTTVSVAAQLGTAPISIYYFNQFPNYFLLTNYIAIPLSTLIIYTALLLLFMSFIPFAAYWVGFALKWMIWTLNKSLGLIAAIPGSISIISISSIQLILLISAILLITAFLFHKKFIHLITGLTAILLFFTNFAIRQYDSLNNSKLIVYSDSRNPIVNFIDGKSNFVYTSDVLSALNAADAYWRSSLLNKPDFIEKNHWFADGMAHFKGKRIMILEDDLLRNKHSKTPLEVDYLILSNRMKPRMDRILENVIPKLVIIDKSISPWYTNNVIDICRENEIPYYSIAESGAFVENLKQ
ncbi:MAG: ComEC/Rec2 family competence protein [Porphyromonadaceae bacterium]|jgi:competence protein ComEC|nr:ComEC/Rec2 family competence protein [Porphyromonadaceae bacterium]